MPGMGGAIGIGGGSGISPGIYDWFFLFRGRRDNKRPSVVTEKPDSVKAVQIHFKKEGKNPNEICGSVQQLFKDKEHHGKI
jgi:hypothetical protein